MAHISNKSFKEILENMGEKSLKKEKTMNFYKGKNTANLTF